MSKSREAAVTIQLRSGSVTVHGRISARLALVLTLIAASPAVSVTPAHASARPKTITLQWVGDMAMSTQLGLPPGGVDQALAPIAGTLHYTDLTLGNLEGTLSVGGISKCGTTGTATSGTCFAFQAPPSTAVALRRLGFDLVNQANNHAQDFGASGHAQTTAALKRAGVAWTGDPGQITYLTTHGVRVAFLGFAPYANTSNLLDLPRAEAMVRTAARHAAIVVVIIHAGRGGRRPAAHPDRHPVLPGREPRQRAPVRPARSSQPGRRSCSAPGRT